MHYIHWAWQLTYVHSIMHVRVCVCVCTRECIVRTYYTRKECLYCVMCDAIYYWMLLYLSPPGISWTRSDLMVGTGIALCQMLHGICACVDVLANCSRCTYVYVRTYVLEAVSACVCMYVCVHVWCTWVNWAIHTVRSHMCLLLCMMSACIICLLLRCLCRSD